MEGPWVAFFFGGAKCDRHAHITHCKDFPRGKGWRFNKSSQNPELKPPLNPTLPPRTLGPRSKPSNNISTSTRKKSDEVMGIDSEAVDESRSPKGLGGVLHVTVRRAKVFFVPWVPLLPPSILPPLGSPLK